MINFMDILRNIKDMYEQRKILNFEEKKFRRYCSDTIFNNKSTTLEREIIVLGHTIEKGLSHKNIKPKFGIKIAKKLENTLKEYDNVEDKDDFILQNGISILQQYVFINEKIGVLKDELPKVKLEMNKYSKSDVGAYMINGHDFFENCQESFEKIAQSRKTMRLYDLTSEKIKVDEIREIIKIAINSPSACNRQAVRVHIVTDQNKIKKICNIQKGANGFGEHAGALLIVTSDLRFYTIAERRLPMYDCGLFAMSLVYAAYQKKLGCCILNGSFDKVQETKCSEIVDIKSYEMISSIILLNKIDDNDSFLIAKSERRKIEDIIRY